MNPLYLGTADRRIFGIHEPAATKAGRPRAALLCYPWGTEYIYAHRSMRHLAVRLATAGFDTLRFDYYGTGDSGGDEPETNPQALQADVSTAIEALKDIAQVPKLTLIGLRTGANIAARVAINARSDVDYLVLWDPVLTLPAEPASSEVQVSPDTPRVSFEDNTLDGLPERSLILLTQDRANYERLIQQRTTLAGANQSPAIEFIEAACPWVEAATNTGALPVPVMQRIQQWLQ